MATVIATVRTLHKRRFRNRDLGLVEVIFEDSTGRSMTAKWFHAHYLDRVFAPGVRVSLFGKVEFDTYLREMSMMHPEFEVLREDDEDGDASLHTGRIVPVYEAAGKVTTRVIRSVIKGLLDKEPKLEDALPAVVTEKLKLPALAVALRETHFPSPETDARVLNAFRSPAQLRLIFEEFFWLEAGMSFKRNQARLEKGIAFKLEPAREPMLRMLPFKPTGAQKKVVREIALDMAAPQPMSRLRARRRRQRQDDRGGAGGSDRGRERLSGGGACSDRDPGHAALSLSEQGVRAAQLPGCPAGGLDDQEGEGERQAGDRHRLCTSGRGHARAAGGGRRVLPAGSLYYRRAAPVRRAAAAEAAEKGRDAGRAGDDRDSDSANAGAHDLRRSRCQRDRRTAAGPQTDQDDSQDAPRGRAGLEFRQTRGGGGPAGVRRLSGDRGDRGQGDEGRGEGVRGPVQDRASRRSRWGCCTASSRRKRRKR